MNVTTHQEKEKNEKTKKIKRKAGEQRKQATDFEGAVCCPKVVAQQVFCGQHSEKMKWSALGNWDPQKGQQPFGPNPNVFGECTTTLRRLLIGAEHECSSPVMRFSST